MKKYLIGAYIAICVLFSSCITNKDLVYLQDKDGKSEENLIINETL